MTDEVAAPSDVLPWERRSEMDLEKAFAQTVVAFFHPVRAWDRTPERSGYLGPLLFAAACGAIGALFTATYNIIVFQWMLRRNPALRARHVPWLMGKALLPLTKLNIVVAPITNAITAAILVFVAAAIIHAGVFLVGARKRSTSGFEGSFRSAAYACAALVAQVVPVIGAVIAFFWYLLIVFPGVARMHRISIGRAVAAVVLPLAVLCGLMLAVTSHL